MGCSQNAEQSNPPSPNLQQTPPPTNNSSTMAMPPQSHCLSSVLPILLLAIHLLPFCSSTSSIRVDVFVNLVQVDAHLNLTYHERLHRVMNRSHQRAMNLHHRGRRGRRHRTAPRPLDHNSSSIETPLQAGHGEFLMKLAIGNPPTSFMAIVDTASDLIWTPCSPCTLCPDQPSTVFDPQGSASYSKLSCSSPSCSALPHVCDPLSNDCQYIYRYGDQSTTSGYLSSETFTLGSASFENVGFGCGTMNWGFHEGAGLVGLNRGRLSLISQLGASVGYQFSYCLSGLEGGSSSSSRLAFGPNSSLPSSSVGAIKLPLLINSRNPDFYFVDLEGISVGGRRLPIEASAFQFKQGGTGGVVVDSGSALMYLVAEAYREVKQTFITAISLPVAAGPTAAGSGLCFQGFVDPSSIPTLTLHFSSGDFCAPRENYFIVDEDSRLSCLAINETPMGMSIIGAFMQQNVHIHYDLGNNLITFTPAQCDQL
ncbi:aspartic proteinase nepenthesin-1-like [Nymphaea colorata]|nr:aspartic proteinase nepenthesin-1-like [Nymphaea colorata]